VNAAAKLPTPEAQYPHATDSSKTSTEADGALTHGEQKSKNTDLFFRSLKKAPRYLLDKLRLKYLHRDRSTIKPRKKCVEKCVREQSLLCSISVFSSKAEGTVCYLNL